MKEKILVVLRGIYDPELPVNIYDLGLIYDISMAGIDKALITMTLTSPNCPMADILIYEIQQKVLEIDGISEVDITLTFDPIWDPHVLSEEVKLDLGLLQYFFIYK